MGRDDWFRQTEWSEQREREFFARLGRSRGDLQKSQYLRIQALTLAETDRKPLVRVAISLLQRFFDEYADSFQLELAHLQAARCHERLSDLARAIIHFRLALAARARTPNADAGSSLEFSWFIVEHELTDLYGEAIEHLHTAHLAFPVQFFKAAAVRAIVAESRGDPRAAAHHAREALDAAGLKHSQFRYHRSLGLVGEHYEPVVQRLSKMAAV